MSLETYYNQEAETVPTPKNGHSFNDAFKEAVKLHAPGIVCPELISAEALQAKEFPPLQYVSTISFITKEKVDDEEEERRASE